MKIKCECGGELRPALLRDYDFSAETGLPVTLNKVAGLRCSKCGGKTLHGRAIEAALHLVALEIARGGRLDADRARFLRRYLGLTQREPSQRMGIVRETVASWECGQTDISPQHDHILRNFAVWKVVACVPVAPAEVAAALDAVRTRRPGRRQPPIDVADLRGILTRAA